MKQRAVLGSLNANHPTTPHSLKPQAPRSKLTNQKSRDASLSLPRKGHIHLRPEQQQQQQQQWSIFDNDNKTPRISNRADSLHNNNGGRNSRRSSTSKRANKPLGRPSSITPAPRNGNQNEHEHDQLLSRKRRAEHIVMQQNNRSNKKQLRARPATSHSLFMTSNTHTVPTISHAQVKWQQPVNKVVDTNNKTDDSMEVESDTLSESLFSPESQQQHPQQHDHHLQAPVPHHKPSTTETRKNKNATPAPARAPAPLLRNGHGPHKYDGNAVTTTATKKAPPSSTAREFAHLEHSPRPPMFSKADIQTLKNMEPDDKQVWAAMTANAGRHSTAPASKGPLFGMTVGDGHTTPVDLPDDEDITLAESSPKTPTEETFEYYFTQSCMHDLCMFWEIEEDNDSSCSGEDLESRSPVFALVGSPEIWSLPDSEASVRFSKKFIFQIGRKKYCHPPLPPGWTMEVSRENDRLLYHPPGTYDCPVPLPVKPRTSSYSHDNQKWKSGRRLSTFLGGRQRMSSASPHHFGAESKSQSSSSSLHSNDALKSPSSPSHIERPAGLRIPTLAMKQQISFAKEARVHNREQLSLLTTAKVGTFDTEDDMDASSQVSESFNMFSPGTNDGSKQGPLNDGDNSLPTPARASAGPSLGIFALEGITEEHVVMHQSQQQAKRKQPMLQQVKPVSMKGRDTEMEDKNVVVATNGNLDPQDDNDDDAMDISPASGTFDSPPTKSSDRSPVAPKPSPREDTSPVSNHQDTTNPDNLDASDKHQNKEKDEVTSSISSPGSSGRQTAESSETSSKKGPIRATSNTAEMTVEEVLVSTTCTAVANAACPASKKANTGVTTNKQTISPELRAVNLDLTIFPADDDDGVDDESRTEDEDQEPPVFRQDDEDERDGPAFPQDEEDRLALPQDEEDGPALPQEDGNEENGPASPQDDDDEDGPGFPQEEDDEDEEDGPGATKHELSEMDSPQMSPISPSTSTTVTPKSNARRESFDSTTTKSSTRRDSFDSHASSMDEKEAEYSPVYRRQIRVCSLQRMERLPKKGRFRIQGKFRKFPE